MIIFLKENGATLLIKTVNPLMLRGKKGRSYLNKPAPKSCRFA